MTRGVSRKDCTTTVREQDIEKGNKKGKDICLMYWVVLIVYIEKNPRPGMRGHHDFIQFHVNLFFPTSGDARISTAIAET